MMTSHSVTATDGVDHPAPHRAKVNPFLLGFAVVGSPVAWSLEMLVSFPLAAHACFPKDVPVLSPTTPGLAGILTGIAIALFVVGVLATAASMVCWWRTRNEKSGGTHQLLEVGEGRTRFIALCGLIISIGFLIALIFEATALYVVRSC
jgi:hypothetical protein